MTERDKNQYDIFKNPQIFIDIRDLFRNGEFYQQNDELEGALISYSSCASMIHTILSMKSMADIRNRESGICPPQIEELGDVTPGRAEARVEDLPAPVEVARTRSDPPPPSTWAGVTRQGTQDQLDQSQRIMEEQRGEIRTLQEQAFSKDQEIERLKAQNSTYNAHQTEKIDTLLNRGSKDAQPNDEIYISTINQSELAFFSKLTSIYQITLSRVEQLQIKLKEKKQKLKSASNSNDEDDEEWMNACTKIHPTVFQEGSKNCIFFKDLAGLTKQKEQIKKALISPLIYSNLYPKVGKGFLLYGPPGTGKTLLVKAAVNELQIEDPNVSVLFFAPTGATLKGKYVGETEKRIVEAYKCASLAACRCEKNSPGKKFISVIFIDELDSIARDRNKDDTGLMANSVNTLLQVMDGIESPENVATIGATNYPWELDAAVLRRFDTQILLGLPDSPQVNKAIYLAFEKFIKLKMNKWELICKKFDTKVDKKEDKEDDSGPVCANGCRPTSSSSSQLVNDTPYNLFKYEFMESYNNGEIQAISDELSSNEKYFSFSDVDKVMGLASSLTATTALDYVFYNPNTSISELTIGTDRSDAKLLENFYISIINRPIEDDSFNKIQANYYNRLSGIFGGSNTDPVFPKTMSSNLEDRVGPQSTSTTLEINQDNLLKFYNDFHIKKFPEKTHIVKGDKIYYNKQLLIDIHPELIIEDPHIKDVFVYCQLDKLQKIYSNQIEEIDNKTVDIETINCLNISDKRRKELISELMTKNKLKVNKSWFGGNKRLVDVIASVDRIIKVENKDDNEFKKRTSAIGLSDYLTNKLEAELFSYFTKSISYINATRKHLDNFIKNIMSFFEFRYNSTIKEYSLVNKKICIIATIFFGNMIYSDSNKNINASLCSNSELKVKIENYIGGQTSLENMIEGLTEGPEGQRNQFIENIRELIMYFLAKVYYNKYSRGDLLNLSVAKSINENTLPSIKQLALFFCKSERNPGIRHILFGDGNKTAYSGYKFEDHLMTDEVHRTTGVNLNNYADIYTEFIRDKRIILNSDEPVVSFENSELISIYSSKEILTLLDDKDTKKLFYENRHSLFGPLYGKFINRLKIVAEYEDHLLKEDVYVSTIENKDVINYNESEINKRLGYLNDFFNFKLTLGTKIPYEYEEHDIKEEDDEETIGKKTKLNKEFNSYQFNILQTETKLFDSVNTYVKEAKRRIDINNMMEQAEKNNKHKSLESLEKIISLYSEFYNTYDLGNLVFLITVHKFLKQVFSKSSIDTVFHNHINEFETTDQVSDRNKALLEFYEMTNDYYLEEYERSGEFSITAEDIVQFVENIIEDENEPLFSSLNTNKTIDIATFLYRAKIDLNNPNYRGVLRSKSFVTASISSFFNKISSFFSSKKKPSKSEFKDLLSKIKDFNPNLTVLNYIISLCNSVGIMNPVEKTIVWSDIGPRLGSINPATNLYETSDDIYQSIFGESPEEEAEKVSSKTVEDKSWWKRLTTQSVAGIGSALAYALGYSTVGVGIIAIQVLYACWYAYQKFRTDGSIEALKELGAQVFAGALGQVLGGAGISLYYGSQAIPLSNAVGSNSLIKAGESVYNNLTIGVGGLVYKFGSGIVTSTGSLVPGALSTLTSIMTLSASFSEGIYGIMLLGLVVMPTIKNLIKRMGGFNDTPQFNYYMNEEIGAYGGNEIVFDNKFFGKSYGKNIYEKYLERYLSQIDKMSVQSAVASMQSVIEADSSIYGTIYTNTTANYHYYQEFVSRDLSPEIKAKISENQKKLKIIDILPNKIKLAASEQPQSYDPILGKMLESYSDNRLKFLEDMKNGKYKTQ